jgi:hypothetical protein
MDNINKLPDEILKKILGVLPIKDKVRCGRGEMLFIIIFSCNYVRIFLSMIGIPIYAIISCYTCKLPDANSCPKKKYNMSNVQRVGIGSMYNVCKILLRTQIPAELDALEVFKTRWTRTISFASGS